MEKTLLGLSYKIPKLSKKVLFYMNYLYELNPKSFILSHTCIV